MEDTEKINSHVILNRSVIKNFVANPKEGKVFTLNLKSLKIERKPADKIGIVQNYFSKKDEEYFSKNYERKLGILIKNLNDNRDYIFTEDDITFVKGFFLALLYRNPYIIDKIISNASNKYTFNDSNSSYVPLILSEVDINTTFVCDFYVDVIFNDSGLDFISSTIGYGALPFKAKDNEIFFIPITPKILICLVNKEDFNNRSYIKKYTITDEHIDVVRSFNCWVAGIAKKTYKSYKNDDYDIYYLFGNGEDELKMIKEILKT